MGYFNKFRRNAYVIIDMNNELRDFTYITNLYKCIANYKLMGHQIGRKVGDMLEILTMGTIYQQEELKRHLNTEGKLLGFTTAGHKVEFGFFIDPDLKEELFGAIECKCVGVEETKFTSGHIKNIEINESFEITLSGKWMRSSITVKVKLIDVSSNNVTIELSNTSDTRVQTIILNPGDDVKLIIDESENFLNTSPHGNMLTEIPSIIRICKTIKCDSISENKCKFTLWNCLTGPQTIEKAKQASLVAMDLRKKIDGHWGKEDVNQDTKKMNFIHVLCEYSHWEDKSRNVIKTCIDHNLVVPDAVLIYAFEKFEHHFGTNSMLNYISKNKFASDPLVQNIINDVLDHFENHILYDIDKQAYVTFDCDGTKLRIINI